ncbi:MAG: helix-turn-helix transcriptional regulator [Chthoniobacterales bacterium]|nr:helix-turn-helix transcriptional regulator [Chthoniobacterales bacterium]
MAGRPPTKDAPDFGKRLAAARRAKGLSQEALAKLLGTTRVNVGYYERKATNPTLEVIQRCAEALSVPVADLIGATAPKNGRKPGPPSRLQKQIEQISQLPRSRQRFVSEMLDTVLQNSSA